MLKNIQVVFHISSSWVLIRLHTENQFLGLAASALKVSVVVVGRGVVWCGWANQFLCQSQLEWRLSWVCDN